MSGKYQCGALDKLPQRFFVRPDSRREPERGAGVAVGHVCAAVGERLAAECPDERGEVLDKLAGVGPRPARDRVGGERQHDDGDRRRFLGFAREMDLRYNHMRAASWCSRSCRR